VTDDRALQLLKSGGTETIDHPGGTLLAHVQRVSTLLKTWNARPAMVSAGLCHAFYGTDGFEITLLDVADRTVLTDAIGEEAEQLVYFYASCDRKTSYQGLSEPNAEFIDRFTGERTRPTLDQLKDFAELTAANELDIATVSPQMRDRFAPFLLDLFTGWRELLSDQAWAHTQKTLARPAP
jgi:hypothetical protein